MHTLVPGIQLNAKKREIKLNFVLFFIFVISLNSPNISWHVFMLKGRKNHNLGRWQFKVMIQNMGGATHLGQKSFGWKTFGWQVIKKACQTIEGDKAVNEILVKCLLA